MSLVYEITLPHPRPVQEIVLEHKTRFRVVEAGRRGGKTQLGINAICDYAIRGKVAAWLAPTYKYLRPAWDACVETLKPIVKSVNIQERFIELITRGRIDFWSLENQDACRGRKYHFVIIDEAGLVKNLKSIWNEAVRPALSDWGGGGMFLGTPKSRNYFHSLYVKGQSGDQNWQSWRFTTEQGGNISPAEIEEARREYEAMGLLNVFDQEYLGIPADDGGNPFGIDAIRNCLIPQLSTKPPKAFGVDLAKYEDYTVVVGLDEDGQMCFLERWRSDWYKTRLKIISRIRGVRTAIDATGVGDPIVEDIRRALGYADDTDVIIGFNFTQTSKQNLMVSLASAIQEQGIGVFAGEREWLKEELESFEYDVRPGGRVSYSAPDGLHDDGVCALALSYLAFRKHLPFAIASGARRTATMTNMWEDSIMDRRQVNIRDRAGRL